MQPAQDILAESVRVQLEKIHASDMLARSERLKRLLRFTIQHVLDGRGGEIKEYLLGVEVFKRGHAYDPRLDPIVRVEMHRLRTLLKRYYETEGGQDPILIEFPKGTYVPVFRKREPPAVKGKRARPRRVSPEERNSIAVLPFADMSPEKDQEYLCEGIAGAVINALTQVEGWRVVCRSSAFRFKGENLDPVEIGRQLHAGSVLEGSVQKLGDRVRVTGELISIPDAYQVWSARYDREMKDVFVIEDEISQAIVHSLSIKLAEGQRAPLARRPSASLQAYELPMRVYDWNQIEPEQMNPLLGRQVIHGENITIARIRLQKSAVVPMHSHANEQMTMLERGALRFVIDGQEKVLHSGEVLQIPPHAPHMVEALEDSLAVDLFVSPIREDWIRGDDAYLRK